MPKILPAFGAVAIIAFSIGFNVARYPVVWEMVGPQAHLPDAAGGSEPQEPSQSTKSFEPIASAPSDTQASNRIANIINEKPENDQWIRTEIQVLPTGVSQAENPAPMTNLVAVPASLLHSNDGRLSEKQPIVRRLPPVYQSAPISAGRYAAEYPQSPMIMYPSTGVD